ncbi:2-iminoacetate synthase ThiH [Clostridium cylindrosporum]|uniref:2-iminoacetate synthase ThiH n=1 Tax=Clostridium cylindrosporum DSM 605 TaxID=1121307 RepID=A0A0J8DBJ5_CLOCY|nr:2-iminoacetate synthase ThiH [Clostridium cylindrosporum]KMT23217.1 2-iminoacetate synthase ThiH [Clostridium cylindrosporum DSM 605]
MSFYETIEMFKKFDFEDYFKKVTTEDVRKSINESNLSYEDLLNLLSPKAQELLEEMAQKSYDLTLNHFGRSVLLYTPMYLANYCVNKCAYCGYNAENNIHRKKLTLEEVASEGKHISKKGFKHILILTGESKYHTPISYIKDCVNVLKNMFPSIAIEVYAMTEEEYSELIDSGVDSLTIYQETYDEKVYDKVHISGPKKDFKFRLDAPERGAKSGMRNIGLGALLGLSDFRKDAFFTALHGEYISRKYRDVGISYALPRIRPCEGDFDDINEVNDRNFVQMLLAFKIFNPTADINISTRERKGFRDSLIPLGVRKLSAGVSTKVGGNTLEDAGEEQFEIEDNRSAEEIKAMIKKLGYQPIFKDWERI